MKMKFSNMAILVNTSDGFSDCWHPFFHLFQKYTSNLASLPIYLNTERLDYSVGSLNLKSTKVWSSDETERPTWSSCLIKALDCIDEEYVLYLQEDYFLTQSIHEEYVSKALEFLKNNENFHAVYLNKYGPIFNDIEYISRDIVKVPNTSGYLVSTQAAIWRRDALRSHCRCWENGWMFEKFATWRAKRTDAKFASIEPSIMDQNPIVDYIYTGVMKGKWHSDCQSLFETNDISVNFVARGFYKGTGRLKTKYEVLTKMLQQPPALWKSIRSIFRNVG